MKVCFDPVNKFFIFDYKEIEKLADNYLPADKIRSFKCVYRDDTQMFRFLDYVLLPSNIESVSVSCLSGGEMAVIIYFDCTQLNPGDIAKYLLPTEVDF